MGPLHTITRAGLTASVHLDEGSGTRARATMFGSRAQCRGGPQPNAQSSERPRDALFSALDSRPFARPVRMSPVGGMLGGRAARTMGIAGSPSNTPGIGGARSLRHPGSGRFFLLRYHARSRRSGRVAEGGALLRRYVGINLRRGFESLLLRFRAALDSPRVACPPRLFSSSHGEVAERSNAAVSKTVTGR